jgi:hypothetical protein
LRVYYKDGETVEEGYQKHLKRFYRAHQEWEERMISKTVLAFTPGATPSQKEKAASKFPFAYAGTPSSMQTRGGPSGER